MANTVRNRCVFYLSGFDPKGAGHYHALYRDEAAKQALVSGMTIDVGRRRRTASSDACWQLKANTPEGPVETHYEFLRWDDIVREHWTRNHARLLWRIVTTTAFNLRHGSLWRMLKVAWPPAVALFSPFVLLFILLLGIPLLATAVFQIRPSAWGFLQTAAAATAVIAAWIWLGSILQKKYGMLWLMRSYAFTARQASGQVPELELRLNQHASRVLSRITSAVDDEVLIVGHSSGTMMAASILAKALRENPRLGTSGPVVSLLTLGHCMPMLGTLPQAQSFRDDLQQLASAQGIDWIDFTAPPDGCCFALADPLTACGLQAAVPVDRPKLLSPRFSEMFEPADYAPLRSDKFRIHFQYLMASAKPVAYDYFAVTAGSKTLAERFRSSPSIKDYRELQIFSF